MWRACLLARDHPSELICLRDLENDSWNADTLYILSSGVNDAAMEELANNWVADEIHWLSEEQAKSRMGGGRGRILVLWWD